MKDKESIFRGACTRCQCPEYCFDGKNLKCADCKCPATRHRSIFYGSTISSSIASVASLLTTGFLRPKEPVKAAPKSKSASSWIFPDVTEIYHYWFPAKKPIVKPIHFSSLDDLAKPIAENFPLVDPTSPLLREFESRLWLSIKVFAFFIIAGICGFRSYTPYLAPLSHLYKGNF